MFTCFRKDPQVLFILCVIFSEGAYTLPFQVGFISNSILLSAHAHQNVLTLLGPATGPDQVSWIILIRQMSLPLFKSVAGELNSLQV